MNPSRDLPLTDLPALPPNPAGCPLPASPTSPALSAASSPQLLWGWKTLSAAARAGTSWLWQGYLAPGAVTLLTSQWKSGKTTLTSVLLARMKTGGHLAGLPLAAGNAVIISEEAPEHWFRRGQKLDFGDHVGWFCRPFRAKPHPVEWLALLDRLVELNVHRPMSLVVIDPLASFIMSGRSENDAGSILEVLLPLQRLTALGLGILVLHHPRKGKARAGQAARGSGALSGYADILIEMRFYNRASDGDRRRRLQAYSRFEETPRQHVIELTADGTDYRSLGTFQEEEFAGFWQVLRTVLESAPHKLTRFQVARAWPRERTWCANTLCRWLERAVEQGLVCKDGQGLRNQPFRYWLQSQEARWRQDPLALLHMPELLSPLPSGERNRG